MNKCPQCENTLVYEGKLRRPSLPEGTMNLWFCHTCVEYLRSNNQGEKI